MPLQRTSIPIGNASYPHYYLCHYLPRSAGRDTLSHSLLKFKLGRQPDLSGWIDCSLNTLAGAGTPILPHTTIVRALHHEETAVHEASPASLDTLGHALAARFQSDYQPSLLRKSRPTREIKGFTREQRAIELQDLYYLAEPAPGPPSVKPNPILIIDDILTTATTIRAIIAVLRTHYTRSTISIFTLAKATYDAPASALSVKGQNYQLEQGMDWVLAEDARDYGILSAPGDINPSAPSPTAQSSYSIQQLMNWIASDDFP